MPKHIFIPARFGSQAIFLSRLASAPILIILVAGLCLAKFPAYLSEFRVFQGVAPHQQNYVVLDDRILSNSRHDLGDLRLYSQSEEVPFELVTMRGDSRLSHAEAKILSAKNLNNTTELVLDVSASPQCDEIDLRLADSARNFVTEAEVESLRAPNEQNGVDLGRAVLFDLSRDGLGSGTTLKFRMTSDRYLRLRFARIAPKQILQATAVNSQADNPSWTQLGGVLPIQQEGEATVITWNASVEAPVMRLAFQVDAAEINFSRDVEVLTPSGGTITNRSVRRLDMVRDGLLVQSEWLDFTLPNEEWGAFKLVVHNGSQPPLKIASVRAYAYERRIYFNPQGRTSFALYYGSPLLSAPGYAQAQPLTSTGVPDVLATLGPPTHNPESLPQNAGVDRPGSLRLSGGVAIGISGENIPVPPDRIRVSASLEAKNLLSSVPPTVPPVAASISGSVVIEAVIAKDGSVKELRYVSGPPLLMKSAMDAVKGWRYQPVMLNGTPVEVDTTISVDFPPAPTN